MKGLELFDCKRFEFSNGLRAVITPIRHMFGVTASLTVRGGTRTETLDTVGVSHAMEHMFFKGGKRYPSSLALAQAVESSGGDHNAFTSKETVAFCVQYGSFKRNLGLRVLEDMIIYGKYTEEELEKEKTAIKSEYRDDFDDMDKVLLRKLCKKLLFGEHPLGYFYKESEKTIARLTTGDLVRYKEQFYKANNLVISVVGNVSADATIKDIERRFGKLERGSVPSWQRFLPEHVPEERVLVFPRKKKKEATIILASPACGYSDADDYAFDIFSTILGEGMGSRLFQRFRDKDGLGYSIDSYTDQYLETGFLLTLLKTDHANIERSIAAVLEEYKKISDEGISDAELRNTKSYLIGKSMVGLNGRELSLGYGSDMALLGEPCTISEYAKGIRAVKKEDVLRVARMYLDQTKIKLGICAEEQYCNEARFIEMLQNVH
ncbi:MAG: insulinase family protein [Candidatus Sungbacteria bacterium]|nr:insulinase family protein [Candidatus Sungbacteria bacterium]